jgi:hypothetical protein
MKKPFFMSTNFLLAVVLFVSAVLGISDAIAKETMAAIIGLVSVGGLLREAVKSAKFIGWDKFFDANTLNYLVGVLVAALPAYAVLFEQGTPLIAKLVEAVIAKDFGAIATGLFSVGSFVFFNFIKKDKEEDKKVG